MPLICSKARKARPSLATVQPDNIHKSCKRVHESHAVPALELEPEQRRHLLQEFEQMRASMEPLLYQAGVDVVFYGHGESQNPLQFERATASLAS